MTVREGEDRIILNTLLDLDSAGLYRRQVDPARKVEVLLSSWSPASSQTPATPVTTAGKHTQARVET